MLDRMFGGAIGPAHMHCAIVGQRLLERLLDHIGRDIVKVDQQHDLVTAHQDILQDKVSPPRSGLICASPNGRTSGKVHG